MDSYKTKAEQNAAITSLQETRALGLKRKMAFKDTELEMSDLLDRCIHGYTFCHRFGNFTTPPPRTTYLRKDGGFTLAAKSDAFFIGTNILCIDIDETGYDDLGTYLERLELKPSFWYTSFSNRQPGKGLRFRLVYVLENSIDGKFFFKYCSEMLNLMVEESTGETIKDKCNLRCSQYFNGTNIDTPGIIVEYGITGNVYSLNEIAGSDYEHYEWWLSGQLENPNLSEADEERIYTELDVEPMEEWEEESDMKVSRDLFMDSIEMEYEAFQTIHRRDFNYIYRCEYDGLPWIDGYYKRVGEGYFELYWNVKPVGIGEGRKSKLLQRSCLRRLMKPDTTANELFWNLYEDVHSKTRAMVVNSDGSITSRTLRRLAEKAMTLELKDIVERYSDNIEYLMTETRPKDGIIIKATACDGLYRGTIGGQYGHKKARLAEYFKNTESGMSVQDNLKNLEEKGLKISRKTEYNYRKAGGEVKRRMTDEELRELLDPGLSANANVKRLQEMNVFVSRKRAGMILQDMPKQTKPADAQANFTFSVPDFPFSFSPSPEPKKVESKKPISINMPPISMQVPDFLHMLQ